VHKEALLSLVATDSFDDDSIPETLTLDIGRLAAMQREFKYICAAASVSATAADAVRNGGSREEYEVCVFFYDNDLYNTLKFTFHL
jgi:hypothetical protein